MSAHLTAEFLTHCVQGCAFHAFDLHDVRNEGCVQLDGKARCQIDSEVIMRNEHDAVRRQHFDQGFPNQFGVGVGQILVSEFPDLRIGGTL